jgi:2-phosphosulfolactate phosphatase
MRATYVTLEDAAPADAVVVIDVLRAFTVAPWLYHQGASRVLAVGERDHAVTLRDTRLPEALLAGEQGGRPVEGFDLGNSPSEVARNDLAGRTVIHRTSAGTQGLVRTSGSGQVFAASFVTAAATAAALREAGVGETTFVITGASLGRDGDEDLAAAELIAARANGQDPDPAPFLERVAASDAGKLFAPEGPDWAPPEDLSMACEVDRFDRALVATPLPDLDAVEVGPAERPTSPGEDCRGNRG